LALSYLQYIITGIILIASRFGYSKYTNFIVHILTTEIAIKYYLDRSFEYEDTGAYVFKSAISILRACFLVVIFAQNGVIDVLLGLAAPTVSILIAFSKTKFAKGNREIIVPAIIVILVGAFLFCFIVLNSQLHLFSNGLLLQEKQEDAMKIIDMFHGKVMVIKLEEFSG